MKDLEEESIQYSIASDITGMMDEEEGIIPVVTDQYACKFSLVHYAFSQQKP